MNLYPAVVDVYRNRRAGLWSIVDPRTRRVIGHEAEVFLVEVQLIVAPARQRASLRGALIETSALCGALRTADGWCRLRYAPAVEDAFLVGYTPVTRTDAAHLDEAGDAYALNPT
jgi:hypothetical protein